MRYDLTNSILNDLINDNFSNKNLMRTDLLENDNGYKILIDLPGIKKENIRIDYKDFNLTVSVAQKNEEAEGYKFLERERFYGNYSRSYYIPNIEEEEIDASFNDGILTILLPYKKTTSKRPIEIK